MARYVTRVRTPLSAEAAFDHLADLWTMAQWDPGVRRVRQVEGDGPGPGAVYDVTVAGLVPVADLTLRYRTVEFTRPSSVRVVATSTLFTSDDRITVEPDGGSTVVTYDADLRLRGPLRLGDLGLRVVFGWIGDRAAAGLRQALQGETIPA